jgi:hypothetical protein
VKPPTIRVGRGSHCIYPCPVTEGYVERADRSRGPLQLTLLAALPVCDGSLALVTARLVLFGAYKQSAAASFFLTLPEGVWELSLGI